MSDKGSQWVSRESARVIGGWPLGEPLPANWDDYLTLASPPRTFCREVTRFCVYTSAPVVGTATFTLHLDGSPTGMEVVMSDGQSLVCVTGAVTVPAGYEVSVYAVTDGDWEPVVVKPTFDWTMCAGLFPSTLLFPSTTLYPRGF